MKIVEDGSVWHNMTSQPKPIISGFFFDIDICHPLGIQFQQ